MKKLNLIICLMLCLVAFANSSYASEMVENGDQKFVFYYQTLVGVRGVSNYDGPTLTTPTTTETFNYTAPRAMSNNNTGNRIIDSVFGEKKYTHESLPLGDNLVVKSSHNDEVEYVVKRQIVSSEEELFEAMGVSGMDDPTITPGQKAMVAAFRSAKSEALKERTEASYRPVIDVLLIDNSAYKGGKTYEDADGNTKTVSDFDFKHDFWSNSGGNKIQMSTSNYSGASAYDTSMSTFLHEYCHSIDKIQHDEYKYGKDGTHYNDEMTSKKAAFVEGWAEYNEMIEYGYSHDNYSKNLATVCVELSDEDLSNYTFDPKLRGKAVEGGWFTNGVSTYTYIFPENMTAEQLMKCESYNRQLLYNLATSTSGIENGKEKVFKAFMKVREMKTGTMADFITQLCKDNPNDIKYIATILDELTYGKMSNEELKEFLGYGNKKVRNEVDAYLANRDTSKISEGTLISITETETSNDGAMSAASEIAPEEDDDEAPELTGTSDEAGSPFNVR